MKKRNGGRVERKERLGITSYHYFSLNSNVKSAERVFSFSSLNAAKEENAEKDTEKTRRIKAMKRSREKLSRRESERRDAKSCKRGWIFGREEVKQGREPRRGGWVEAMVEGRAGKGGARGRTGDL